MIRNLSKSALRLVGLDPTRVATAFRSSRLGISLNERYVAKLVSDRQTRERFIIEAIEKQNPQLLQPKPEGTTRIGVLWDRRDRFRWLGYVADDDNDCEIVRLRISMFRPVWRRYLRDYLVNTVAEHNMGEYPLDTYFKPQYEQGRKIYYAYCLEVAKFISSHYKIDVFLLPKLNDDWALEIVRAFNAVNIPMMIDDREGANTKKRLEVVPPRLRVLLDSGIDFDLLCVHNEAHRQLFVDAGYNPDKIIINGAPESDYWSRSDLWIERASIDPRLRDDKILILFFSFGPRNFLHFYYGDEKRDWSELGADYHDIIIRLLEKHGDRIQIAYKLGGQTSRDRFPGYDAFAEKAKPYLESGALIELLGSVNSFDLLVNADVTIGFLTSGLTEAMFLDKPIICGGWGDLYEDIKDTLLPFHETEALTFASSKESMWDALDPIIEDPKSFVLTEKIATARKTFRESFFHNPDGNVSRRLLAHVKRISQQGKHKSQ